VIPRYSLVAGEPVFRLHAMPFTCARRLVPGVSDTGTCDGRAVSAKVFDPFFTSQFVQAVSGPGRFCSWDRWRPRAAID